MILENNLTFTKQVTRDFQKEYKGPTHRGATIYVKRPPRYTVRDGQNVNLQDTTITQVPVTLNHQFGVDVVFSSQDLTLSIDGFSEQVLGPQITAIANQIDYVGLQLAGSVSNVVGTPGVTPGAGATAQQTLQVFSSSMAMLDKTGTPRDGNRAFVINEDAQATVIPSLSGLFQGSDSIASQYSKGTMGVALGGKWSMSQNVATYTTGAQGGTPLINGVIAPQVGPSGTALSATPTTFAIPTKGWPVSSPVLNAGDVITCGGSFAVNPVSLQPYNLLKRFVLASNAVSDASGNATLIVTEPMIVAGAFKNVTAVPANNAPITVLTAPANTITPMNLAFHKNAFTLACVDLPIPGGVHMGARKSDDQLGLSMRFVAAYNVSTDQFIGRFDILCGWAAIRPEWACRIQG